jgi:thioesterase domain-containing protein
LGFVDSINELFAPLCAGVPIAVIPDDISRNAGALVDELAARSVTRLVIVPSYLASLLDNVDRIGERLPLLAHWTVSGERLGAELARRFFDHFPSARLWNIYGSTEVTADATWYEVRADDDLSADVPIGRPIANVRCYVIEESGRLAPVGARGELLVAGAGVTLGYWRRPRLDSEKFVSDPFSDTPGARAFRTGDLARYRSDGTLEYAGRSDNQVKVRGQRVELGEIEAVLEQHEAVRRATVTVHDISPGDRRLVGYVELRRRELGAAELLAWARMHLPAVMVPSAIIPLERLPRTNSSGKIDRLSLPDPTETLLAGRGGTPARSELERHLVEVWSTVLQSSSIGVDEDFFDRGGHSLLAVQLLSAVREVFGQDLPLRSLLDAPTIASQARLLDDGVGRPGTDPLVRISSGDSSPPIFCVCSLGGTVLNLRPLAERMGKNRPFYGLQAVHLDMPDGLAPTVEDYAARYVESVRSVAGRGPLVLGGHSFGAVVAFEMARQFAQEGTRVSCLFVLDSGAPNVGAPTFGERVETMAGALAGLPELPRQLAARARHDPDGTVAFLRKGLRRFGRSLLQTTTAVGDTNKSPFLGLAADEVIDMTHWPEQNRSIARRHLEAIRRYTPGPYDGTVTLLRARRQRFLHGRGRKKGWDRVAATVDVHSVSGDHLTLLSPPFVDTTAKVLRACLDATPGGPRDR